MNKPFPKKAIFIFPFFLLLTLVLYYPTIGSGFTTDVTGGIERLSTRPFKEVFISFGFPALNQLSVFLFYIQYKLFGMNGLGWYLVYGSLHSINAYLLYKFFHKIFSAFTIQNAFLIAVVGALFFLISPYQSEVVVWKACQNYLLSVCFIFLCLLNVLVYLSAPNKRNLLKVHGFFLLALFTFEYALILPLLISVLILAWKLSLEKTKQVGIAFSVLVVPQIMAIGLYFILTKLLFGQWIGHYGADVHLQFVLKDMLANGLKFLGKYLFFIRFYPHAYKTAIFTFIDTYAYLLFFAIAISSVSLIVYSFKRKKNALFLSLLSLLLFGVALSPVLNLYFYYLQDLINDRHGYLASAFLLMGLSLLFFQLPKYVKNFIIIAYCLCSLSFLVHLNAQWKTSTSIFCSLMEDFRWYDAPKVLLLNVPENYKGMYLFRIIGEGSGFEDALEHIHAKEFSGTMLEVVQYNMANPTDGVTVESLAKNRLKVTFNQWGNWFWRNGIGAGGGYENEYYKVVFKGQYYELELKSGLENAVLLYQDGKEWKEFYR